MEEERKQEQAEELSEATVRLYRSYITGHEGVSESGRDLPHPQALRVLDACLELLPRVRKQAEEIATLKRAVMEVAVQLRECRVQLVGLLVDK